jgi:hypothetical protein
MTDQNAYRNDRPVQPIRPVSPSGKSMTRADLPPANTKRWVIQRKAEVVAGVRSGLISLDEACERYSLSVDEFLSWQRLLGEHGLEGLRTTRIKEFRTPISPTAPRHSPPIKRRGTAPER